METTTYISDLLRNNMHLFAAIYDFNNGMVKYMHADFFPEMFSKQLLRTFTQSPKYCGEILAYIRRWLNMDNLGCYNFSEQRYWLCLFSPEEIQRIIGHIGGICFAEQIRKIILGRELLKLKHAIGNDAYLFSIRSASLILRTEVAERFQLEGENFVERVYNTGKAIIEMSLAGIPRELTQRFALKFPKNFGWNFTRKVENPQYYFDFIRKVVKRVLNESDNIAVTMIKA
ncbi:MAG: SctK family type III secretion system sorting platform protein [Puniceicoccales bacterium]|jgi:hypothetical protein|nr:SctK family type III secretion system sorting platform protein [Puniceicoccales bacterium]